MKTDPSADPRDVQPEIAALADRLYLAVVHMLRRLRGVDDELGLTAPQLSAITRLMARGEMTLGELAAAEGVRPPTITRLVQRLEGLGLVVRRPDPRDARVQRIAHTGRVAGVLEAGRKARVEAFGDQLAALSKRDRDALGRAIGILERLARAPTDEEIRTRSR